MDIKRIKRGLIFSSIFVVISAAGVTRLKDLDLIRLVDLMTILACGVCIGVMLVFLMMYIRLKGK